MSFFDNVKKAATADVDALKAEIVKLEAELAAKTTTVEAEIKKELPQVGAFFETVYKKAAYDVETAATNVKTELQKLDTFIKDKIQAIETNKVVIAETQSIIAALEADKAKAEAFFSKLVSSLEAAPAPAAPVVTPTPVVTPAPTTPVVKAA